MKNERRDAEKAQKNSLVFSSLRLCVHFFFPKRKKEARPDFAARASFKIRTDPPLPCESGLVEPFNKVGTVNRSRGYSRLSRLPLPDRAARTRRASRACVGRAASPRVDYRFNQICALESRTPQNIRIRGCYRQNGEAAISELPIANCQLPN